MYVQLLLRPDERGFLYMMNWLTVNGIANDGGDTNSDEGSGSVETPDHGQGDTMMDTRQSFQPMKRLETVAGSPPEASFQSSNHQKDNYNSGSTDLVGTAPRTGSEIMEDNPHFDFGLFTDLADFDSTLAGWSQASFIYDIPSRADSSPLALDEEKWHVSNKAYIQGIETAKSTYAEPDFIDPNVPFKAILWGWHTVEEKERNHPIWRTLRQVDERVFGGWKRKPQKIAIMYVTQFLMKVSIFV
jgi:hypothetical protein